MNLTQLPVRIAEIDAMKRIFHLDFGHGLSVLIFIHTFGCNRKGWKAQVAIFSSRNRCIAVDLGGLS
ncbi:MAG: hypothetical protein CMP14_03980 [Rickettsiales bacterium]|nr:hypothetical protein [Rickettsiales bacterium]